MHQKREFKRSIIARNLLWGLVILVVFCTIVLIRSCT